MSLLKLSTIFVFLVLLLACGERGNEAGRGESRHDSIDDGGRTHDSIDDEPGHSHGGGHGHDHDESHIVLTHFSEQTQLFVQFPALVKGEASVFAVHFTKLDSFKPVQQGKVNVILSGGGAADEVFAVDTTDVPGIFRPLVQAQHAGKRRLTLNLKNDKLDVNHDLGEFLVAETEIEALSNLPDQRQAEDAIPYSLEQQWQVDFGLAQAARQTLRASLLATGTVRPRSDGEVYLSASSAGHVQSKGKFPFPGMNVTRGQVLATIRPRLGAGGDLATLKAARDKTRSEHNLAKHERERLEKLWTDNAIAKHRLHEAESNEEVARAEMESAQRRYRQSTGGRRSSNSGIPVLAPINGVLAQVQAAPGKYLNEGDLMFHIVNVDKLWLEIRLAEADIGRLQQPSGAWFRVQGFKEPFNTFDLEGQLIALGGVIDPVSRTVPLIFQFNNPDQRLRAGMFANTRVYTGEESTGVSIPASAVYDDGGQEVVYVMLAGESFQRRIVLLGIRDGDRVQVLSGLEPGEWIVSRGAYLVRLASASPAEAGHGHAH